MKHLGLGVGDSEDLYLYRRFDTKLAPVQNFALVLI
jgi:hypothetical protein